MALKGYVEVPVLVTEEVARPASRKNPEQAPRQPEGLSGWPPEKGKRYRAPRYKVSLVKESGSVYVPKKPILTAGDVYYVTKELFEDTDRELFYVLCLDLKSKIIGINMVSMGTLSMSLVHPREVYKPAVALNSASVIAVHNHPSGNPAPSWHDKAFTTRLVIAGAMIGIDLIDHVIAGEDAWYSFAEMNELLIRNAKEKAKGLIK